LKLAGAGGFVLETDASGKATITGDLTVTGQIKANGQVTAHADGSFVTLTQHFHAANNTPPTPGH
jgi:phage baseplate assembly protein gpV